MAAGDSLRGLSLVTTATSARSAACPSFGRFVRSRSPPARRHRSADRCQTSQTSQATPQCIVCMGVVDEDIEGLAAIDLFQPTGNTMKCLDSRGNLFG